MATSLLTVTNGQFPAGTLVAAYPRSAKLIGHSPTGSPLDTDTVTATSTLTFDGLAEETEFTAYAEVSGTHRYQDFATYQPRSGGEFRGLDDVDWSSFSDDEVPVYDATGQVFTGEPLPGTVTTLETAMAVVKEAPLNVQYPEYGAAGDGTADDTTEIQAAIDAAAVAGGEVLIPAGVFRHSDLNLKTNVTLRGLGRASILKTLDAGGSIRNVNYTANGATTDTGIVVRDLDIDGNRTAVPVGNHFGLILASASGFLIDNVHMRACYRTCLRLGGDATVNGSADRGVVRASRFSDAGGVDGLGAAYGVGLSIIRGSRIDIESCFFDTNATHGFDAEPNAATSVVENIKILGGAAHNNAQGGYTFYNATASQDTETVRNNKLIGAAAYSNGHDGVRIFGHRRVTVALTDIYSNTLDGIKVENYNTGVRVLDNDVRGNTGNGLNFTSQIGPIALVRGNRFRANTGWGAIIGAVRATAWLDFIDNQLLGNTAGHRSLPGPSTNGRIVDRDSFTATSDAPTGLGPTW